MCSRFVGVDVSKDFFSAAGLDEGGDRAFFFLLRDEFGWLHAILKGPFSKG